jgi:membrane associated rhomboid family serine protease
MTTYYRDSLSIYFGGSFTRSVKGLIFFSIGVFFPVYLLNVSYPGLYFWVVNHFGLKPEFIIGYLALWQFVTYMFLHGDILHLAFNMLALWMFGGEVESVWGSRRFLFYFFLTGIGGGVLSFLSTPTSATVTIGASGAIFGLLLAYGLMFPNRTVLVFFLFPMRAKYFVLLFAGLELLASWNHTGDGIAHFAHLGGMVVGYFYLRYQNRWENFYIYLNSRRPRSRKKLAVQAGQTIDAIGTITAPGTGEVSDDIEIIDLKDRVDGILDKISSQGIDSLTEAEKKILEKASSITKRRP